jgi:hypothetical protein
MWSIAFDLRAILLCSAFQSDHFCRFGRVYAYIVSLVRIRIGIVRGERRRSNDENLMIGCLGATGPSAHSVGAGSSWGQRVSISPAYVNFNLVEEQRMRSNFVGATFY